MATYLDQLELQLTQHPSLSTEDRRLLLEKLIRYKQNIPQLFTILFSGAIEMPNSDTGYLRKMLPDLYHSLPVLHGYTEFPLKEKQIEEWSATTFDNDPLLNRLTLNRIRAEVMMSAYQTIAFCKKSFNMIMEDFTEWSCIVTLTSKIVRAGDTVEIKAGLGRFYTDSSVRITIANAAIHINSSGVATRTLTAPKKPGKYRIPVTVEFTKPDGSKERSDATLTYEVSHLP